MKDKIQLFEEKQVRSVWDDEKEQWYFAIVDVVAALTDSANPTDYLKKMRKRDPDLGIYLGTNCPQVAMRTASGKKRKTLAGTLQDIFRLIQSIPSPKAEPFKRWLAKVGAERIDEEIDPQKAIDRAVETYRAKGYPEPWIKARIQGIHARNELTDEWKAHGVQNDQYAVLTNIIHRGTFGISVKEHKHLKGLKKENLRDNMTTVEAALTTLAEVSTTEITRSRNPKTLNDNKAVAREGSGIAKRARLDIERRTGRKVVSAENAKNLIERAKAAAAIPGKAKEKAD
nr:MAG TPA: BRO family protein [Caudoviricetes sp.]